MTDITPEEFLEHYGVKGMSWGSRKAEGGGVSPAQQRRVDAKVVRDAKINAVNATRPRDTRSQATINKEIDDIANMQVGRAPKAPKAVAVKAQKPTSADIYAARERNAARYKKFQEAQGDYYVATGHKAQTKTEALMRKYEKEAFDNADTKTAARITSGEKVALSIFATYGVLVVAGAVALSKGY